MKGKSDINAASSVCSLLTRMVLAIRFAKNTCVICFYPPTQLSIALDWFVNSKFLKQFLILPLAIRHSKSVHKFLPELRMASSNRSLSMQWAMYILLNDMQTNTSKCHTKNQ